MSGGHFNYDQFIFSQFADGLEREIKNNKICNSDDPGKYAPNFSPQTLAKLCVCLDVIRAAANLAHATDWLYAGDDGEEEFAKKYQLEIETLFGGAAKRLFAVFNSIPSEKFENPAQEINKGIDRR